MPEAYIVDAARTATGKRRGGFATTHPADLGAARRPRDLQRMNATETRKPPTRAVDGACADAVGTPDGVRNRCIQP